MQVGVYLSSTPSLALATAEGTADRIADLGLIAVSVSSAELHPDDDIFLYPEVLDNLSSDTLNKLFGGHSDPSSLIASMLEDGDDDTLDIVNTLTIKAHYLKEFDNLLGNGVYYGDIGFNGDPAIVGVGLYIDIDGMWVLQESNGDFLPNTIERI
jgi:hypothetical protein